MLQLPSKSKINLQLKLLNQTISQAGLRILLSLLILSIDKYDILTIDPVKLKTTIHKVDIDTKSSNGPLLKRHNSYILFARYYPPPDSNHYCRLSLETLHTYYFLLAPHKDL